MDRAPYTDECLPGIAQAFASAAGIDSERVLSAWKRTAEGYFVLLIDIVGEISKETFKETVRRMSIFSKGDGDRSLVLMRFERAVVDRPIGWGMVKMDGTIFPMLKGFNETVGGLGSGA